MGEEIVNKVAASGLVTIDMEEWYPEGERILIDIKQQLFQELILREKDFREYIKTTNWSFYKDKYVAITCSADAIVPTWAFMLLTTALAPFAKEVVFGSLEDLENIIFGKIINSLNTDNYKDARIIIKGCSKRHIPIGTYVALTNKLQPVAKSIMYGEPCSTVPLYKK